MEPCNDYATPNNALSCNGLNSTENRSIYIHYCATLTKPVICDPRFDTFTTIFICEAVSYIFAWRRLFSR